VYDQYFVEGYLEKIDDGADSLTAEIHVNRGNQQANIAAAEADLGCAGVKSAFARKSNAGLPCQFFNQPGSGVVARLFIFPARVAQAGYELNCHRRRALVFRLLFSRFGVIIAFDVSVVLNAAARSNDVGDRQVVIFAVRQGNTFNTFRQ